MGCQDLVIVKCPGKNFFQSCWDGATKSDTVGPRCLMADMTRADLTRGRMSRGRCDLGIF